jgi:hypothetical protein
MGREGAEGPLRGDGDRVVAVLLHRLDVLVHEGLDELAVALDAPEGEDHAVRVEGGAVVEGDALAEGEAPGGVVDGTPGLGERGDELGVVGDVDERVEEVAQHGGGGNRVVVGGIEGEHALGEPGGDFAAALGLPGGERGRARQGEGCPAHREEIPPVDVMGSWMLLAH